ncbi:hypothetical protein C2S51_032219 [Perilla frutescens var. frutescens]|nr:hypothetical protein C2S51_032219 [Perilla frutescens var. frutescens]
MAPEHFQLHLTRLRFRNTFNTYRKSKRRCPLAPIGALRPLNPRFADRVFNSARPPINSALGCSRKPLVLQPPFPKAKKTFHALSPLDQQSSPLFPPSRGSRRHIDRLPRTTMSPLKLLEVTIISAHNLPPVSKMLRTFAVAYVTPDHKLTTRIDHHGHTKPSWNYKMLFHVDKTFLMQESSVLTIEIYNLAWLRDLPIGTARLHLNTLSPPQRSKNNAYRRLSLHLSQPSGHLKGTLNLGIQLMDDVVDDISMFSSEKTEEESVAQEILSEKQKEDFQGPEQNPGPEIKSKNESCSSTPESLYTSRPESEPETRTITSGGSIYSVMRPLPSEVADDLKKGFYRAEAEEYGSEIFENWTEVGDTSEDQGRKPESAKWAEKDVIPLTTELTLDCHRKRPEKKTGLFKLIGNAYGFEFTFICGSNEMKMKKKKNVKRMHQKAFSDESLGKFYG